MKAGMTKNSAGIGGRIEELPRLGAFATMTGGNENQRRHERDYLKVAHRDQDKLDKDAATDVLPLLNISGPQRVL